MRPRHRASRPAVVLAVATALSAALLTAACGIPLARRKNAPTFDTKRIYAKAEPDQLQADDGTWCTVPRKKYIRSEIGTHAWCVWSRDGDPRRAVVSTRPPF